MECFWSRWGKFHCSACKKSNKRQKRNQQQGAFQKSLKYDWWTSCPSQQKRADQSSSPQVQPIFNNKLKISIWKQERGFLSQLNPGWSSASFFRKDWLIGSYTLTRWFKVSFFFNVFTWNLAPAHGNFLFSLTLNTGSLLFLLNGCDWPGLPLTCWELFRQELFKMGLHSSEAWTASLSPPLEKSQSEVLYLLCGWSPWKPVTD